MPLKRQRKTNDPGSKQTQQQLPAYAAQVVDPIAQLQHLKSIAVTATCGGISYVYETFPCTILAAYPHAPLYRSAALLSSLEKCTTHDF